MRDANVLFHFPPDISLNASPLIEAWLDIRWQLKPSKSFPNSFVDSNFPFALGVFYEKVSDRFSVKEELPMASAPIEAFPYTVRYKFTQKSSTSPIIQLGPGVASVNYTEDYSWQKFEHDALYLRNKLINAYKQLNVQSLTLRYRNAISFDFLSEDLFEFLRSYLNLSVTPPLHIPGNVARSVGPTDWQSVFTYDLLTPRGKGTIRFSTGHQSSDESNQRTPVLVFDLDVQSQHVDDPNLFSEECFPIWMEQAHSVIHEWFFALIDGSLRNRYEGDAK